MSLKLKAPKDRKKQIVITDDFYYDLFIGGYIKPSDFLNDDSTRKVMNAVAIIHDFEELLRNHKILEDF